MWFYKGIKVNILATTQKTAVALIYKINPVQITTLIAENTKNSLNMVPKTIENIQFKKLWEILTYCKGKKWHFFSSVMAIVTQIV